MTPEESVRQAVREIESLPREEKIRAGCELLDGAMKAGDYRRVAELARHAGRAMTPTMVWEFLEETGRERGDSPGQVFAEVYGPLARPE